MDTTYKDWRGNPITVGCHVVYPVRQSSQMWMNEAEVTQVVENSAGLNTDGFFIRGRLIKSGDIYTDERSRQRKVVTISSVNRVTVVDGD